MMYIYIDNNQRLAMYSSGQIEYNSESFTEIYVDDFDIEKIQTSKQTYYRNGQFEYIN